MTGSACQWCAVRLPTSRRRVLRKVGEGECKTRGRTDGRDVVFAAAPWVNHRMTALGLAILVAS
jgi:hypothetical protein